MNKTAIVILAAGNSSRLGRPKQLLPYRGKPLIAHVVTEAIEAGPESVIVVTGAFAAEVGAVLTGGRVEIVYNPRWEEGMASGIAVAVNHFLSTKPHIEAVILAVCDQPYISAALLRQLSAEQQATGKGIVACSYANTVGTPVLFTGEYFGALSGLTGNDGAKKLLRQFKNEVATVFFPQGEIDIDTEEDYLRLG